MSIKKVALTASQAEFATAKESSLLFAGGYGCGKSYLMGFMAVNDALHSANSVIGLYEPDYSKIKSIAVPNVQYWLAELGLVGTYNKQDHILYTSSPGIGDFVFMSMDRPELLVGYQTYASHLDELDLLPIEHARTAWQKILARNRQAPRDVPKEHRIWVPENERYEVINKMRAYSTPEGFKFCYQNWAIQNRNDPEFRIVKGKTEDNPTLSKAYVDKLKAQYPAHLIKAYLEGEFVNLASDNVYYSYDRESHKTEEVIRPGETLYIGCDFNVSKTCATVYVRRDGGREWHAVDEMHGLLDTPDLVNTIRNRYYATNPNIIMYPDSSGGNRSASNASSSSIALLKEAGFAIRAHSKNPAVVDRIAATNRMLSDGKLFVSIDNCPETIRCLEQQAYNKKGEPDKDSGTDHQNDATTYPIAYECAIRKPLFKIDFKFAQKSLY